MDDSSLRELAAQSTGAGVLGVIGRLVALAHAGAMRPTGWSLLWEIPLAIGLGLVGKGIAEWCGLVDFPAYAVTIAVSYAGPRLLDIGLLRLIRNSNQGAL